MVSYGIQGYYGLESVDDGGWSGVAFRIGGFAKTAHFFLDHETDDVSRQVRTSYIGPAMQVAVKIFKYGELYLGGATPLMFIDSFSNVHPLFEVDFGVKISI
ncbi:MAG: hypothetical protein OCD76_17870 [Reichenbachiella sp.]